MTDAAQGQPQGPVFGVLAQYLKDLSFESPRAPDVFLAQGANPQVSADVKTEARPLADGVYEVELLIAAKAAAGDDVVFQIECLYAGVFQVQGVPQEHLGPFLMIECPRLLFPFARNVVADATREGGFPPLMLQPVDFVELYRRRAEAQAAGGEAPQPSAVGPSSKIILPN
ncbi:MAG: protein-export chaperone SecB [Azospirillum sp.]|jgi:preprotein translocase subunit SecB|nr:protein-export chaperone SecB [Azospirillum sp.]MCA3266381.1 protein-export chaperone SecB [Azospirillum sp.]MCZ8121803.1 protein-export chaperone SecB [Magnetospirillum sp.]